MKEVVWSRGLDGAGLHMKGSLTRGLFALSRRKLAPGRAEGPPRSQSIMKYRN